MASSQMMISKNAITGARYFMPLDKKTIRSVSMQTFATWARKMRIGRMSQLKRSGLTR